MANSCYALFKSTYNQAIADGFAVAVATAAAQAAMTSCLATQAVQVAPSQGVTTVPGSRLPDPGPSTPIVRGTNLGPKD